MPTTVPIDRLHLVNVTVISHNPLTLRCDVCGAVWSPLRHQSDFLRSNFWNCPENGCNDALAVPTLGEIGQSR